MKIGFKDFTLFRIEYKVLIICSFVNYYEICHQFRHHLKNKNPQDVDLTGSAI